jgi:hypothetical protein
MDVQDEAVCSPVFRSLTRAAARFGRLNRMALHLLHKNRSKWFERHPMPVIHNPRLRHTLWGVVLVFVLLEFGRTTLGKFSIVEGDSMSPTFTAGDFVHAGGPT